MTFLSRKEQVSWSLCLSSGDSLPTKYWAVLFNRIWGSGCCTSSRMSFCEESLTVLRTNPSGTISWEVNDFIWVSVQRKRTLRVDLLDDGFSPFPFTRPSFLSQTSCSTLDARWNDSSFRSRDRVVISSIESTTARIMSLPPLPVSDTMTGPSWPAAILHGSKSLQDVLPLETASRNVLTSHVCIPTTVTLSSVTWMKLPSTNCLVEKAKVFIYRNQNTWLLSICSICLNIDI